MIKEAKAAMIKRGSYDQTKVPMIKDNDQR